MRFQKDANEPFGDAVSLALFSHFSLVDISIQLCKNAARKPFGLKVGDLFLSWAVLLLEDSVGNKAVGMVDRMTSHLGQAPALLLSWPFKWIQAIPGKHSEVLKKPHHHSWNWWYSLSLSQIIKCPFLSLGVCFLATALIIMAM